MTLSELKTALTQVSEIHINLPNGESLPAHFHITEVGKFQKDFIDCGGTLRQEVSISLQLWVADDTDHRLAPQKLLNIIRLTESKIVLPNANIEVEYQGETIQKFGLVFIDGRFVLSSKMTDCLAKDKCGIPEYSPEVEVKNTCAPDSGCC